MVTYLLIGTGVLLVVGMIILFNREEMKGLSRETIKETVKSTLSALISGIVIKRFV